MDGRTQSGRGGKKSGWAEGGTWDPTWKVDNKIGVRTNTSVLGEEMGRQ